jgi:hypothetical protein
VKRMMIVLAILVAAAIPAAASAQTPTPHFVGHGGCTISTCRYFTSSYHTAIYYYDRRTCSQWKSLSRKYLNGFKTVRGLHARFPHRKLHPPC